MANRTQLYRKGMPAKYSKGLSPRQAAARAKYFKMLAKKQKEGRTTKADYDKKAPGD
jgi:hypothetical protein